VRGNRKLVALLVCVGVTLALVAVLMVWPGRLPDTQLDSLLSFLSTAAVAFFGSNVASHWLNGRNRTADSPAKGPADPAEGA